MVLLLPLLQVGLLQQPQQLPLCCFCSSWQQCLPQHSAALHCCCLTCASCWRADLLLVRPLLLLLLVELLLLLLQECGWTPELHQNFCFKFSIQILRYTMVQS